MTQAQKIAPPDWQQFQLGDLLKFSNGINADKSAYGSGVPFANVFEVINNESLTEREIPGRVSLAPQVLARYEVQTGDLLFNRTSETQEEVALASVYLGTQPIVFGGFVFRGRPLTKDLDPNYSKYALRMAAVRDQITARGQGGIRANISQRDLKAVTVALPSRREQQVIAEVIDDATTLIGHLERLIAKRQAIKQGMMQQLLTGRTRLSGFASEWQRVKLGSVAQMGSGGTPLSSVARFYGGGIPWVSIADMTRGGKYIQHTEKTLSNDGLSASAAKLYDSNVVLYAMYASLGECSLASGRVSSSQAILGISTGPRLDREFLYYFLVSVKPRVKLLGQQGTQSNLNAGIVRSFDIPLPDLDEQVAIADSLADVDSELASLSARLDKAQAVKQGMMQQLLTGRTRLPVAEAAA